MLSQPLIGWSHAVPEITSSTTTDKSCMLYRGVIVGKIAAINKRQSPTYQDPMLALRRDTWRRHDVDRPMTNRHISRHLEPNIRTRQSPWQRMCVTCVIGDCTHWLTTAVKATRQDTRCSHSRETHTHRKHSCPENDVENRKHFHWVWWEWRERERERERNQRVEFSGGFRGGRAGSAPPPLWATDWRRHSRYSWCVTTLLHYGDTIASLSHVKLKHGSQIFKMIATSGFLTSLECTKFVFGRGSAPYSAGGAYSATPDPL